MTFKSSKSLI